MECKEIKEMEDIVSATLSELHQDDVIDCNQYHHVDFYKLAHRVKKLMLIKNGVKPVKLREWQKNVIDDFNNMRGKKIYNVDRRAGKSFIAAFISQNEDVLIIVRTQVNKKQLVDYGANENKITTIYDKNIINKTGVHVVVDDWSMLNEKQKELCNQIYMTRNRNYFIFDSSE